MKENTFLETEKPGKLMRRYAFPCVISLLVAALYNIVDQIFIANTPTLGSAGNAANTVVFPLTVVALAIAVMIGDGCCAFVSMKLGSKDAQSAHKGVGNAVLMTVGASAVLTVLALTCSDFLLTAFGGGINAETFAFSREYFFPIALGLPFYMFGQAMNPVIRSDGSPRYAMLAGLSGAVVNLLLDPLFLFVFGWGMTGAAVATVLGQILTAALSLRYLFFTKSMRLKAESFRFSPKLCRTILLYGLCSFLAQISLVAAMAAINNMIRISGAADPVFSLQEYTQIPMAVVGIVMKFFQIVISVSIGLAAGCIPIVGYNAGAGHPDRIRSVLTRLLLLEFGIGAAALLLIELFPGTLIGIFGAAEETPCYTAFALRAFRIYLCMLPLACVNKACFIFLQSLGKAWSSTALSVLREIVFGVGFALLLPRFFGLDGVLYSMPVSDLLTFAVSLLFLFLTYRSLSRDIRAKKSCLSPSSAV